MTHTKISIDVMIKDPLWSEALPQAGDFCRSVIEAALQSSTFKHHGELSIALIDDTNMQMLNRNYRSKDAPTNVLSFPDHGPAPVLGDIVIARETVMTEAQAANISMRDHLAHMLVHGFLHLQGYDHMNDSDAAEMEALEAESLAVLNIDNPYKLTNL